MSLIELRWLFVTGVLLLGGVSILVTAALSRFVDRLRPRTGSVRPAERRRDVAAPRHETVDRATGRRAA